MATIREAILKVFDLLDKPLTPEKIYDKIIEEDLSHSILNPQYM